MISWRFPRRPKSLRKIYPAPPSHRPLPQPAAPPHHPLLRRGVATAVSISMKSPGHRRTMTSPSLPHALGHVRRSVPQTRFFRRLRMSGPTPRNVSERRVRRHPPHHVALRRRPPLPGKCRMWRFHRLAGRARAVYCMPPPPPLLSRAPRLLHGKRRQENAVPPSRQNSLGICVPSSRPSTCTP